MSNSDRKEKGLTKAEIVAGLRQVGLKEGDVTLVHSAMRTFGYVEGGADTVVDALLEVLGPGGTLVVPAFTFVHEVEDDPLIDPANDPSEMGIISETVRRRPKALRSTAFRHSFAAIGRRAKVITEVDPALSSFDLRSSFGVMLALNTQVLYLGVAYATSSTSHHFAEWVCDVPYRHAIRLEVKLRKPNGSIIKQNMVDYQPKPSGDGSYYGSRHTDFNRMGQMLEDMDKVGIATIGNAVVRRASMRNIVDLAQVEAAKDYNIFRTEENQHDFSPLKFGKTIYSPEMKDGAGRAGRYQWCVVDETKIFIR